MTNSWLRLWHDMPNDPKWRTIARVSKQPIPSVLSVYIHLLVIASNATERGRTQNVCSEDIASALDMEAEQIDAILNAMQGRVLDGDRVSGWAKRQVEREDGSAERAKRWREAQKEAKQTQPNATERNRTPDKDKDTDNKNTHDVRFNFKTALIESGAKPELVDDWLKVRKAKRAANTKTAFDGFIREIGKAEFTINQALEVCCSRSWQGFNADWVKDTSPTVSGGVPAIDTSLEGRRAALQAQYDADFPERVWLPGETPYRTIVTIENGKIKRNREPVGGAA